MVKRMIGGPGRGRFLLLVVVTLALLTLFAIGAQSALAYMGWVHSAANTCASCHPGGNTGVPGTNAACQGCHPGPSVRTGYDCWSCHKPGAAVVASPCNGCHLYAGDNPPTYTTAHSHPAHVGSNLKVCTTCHNLTVDNPHHSTAAVAAPTCTTCHAATPVDGAPVPHGTYVVGVVCSTCHKGVDPNHPLSAAVKTPTLTFTATQPLGNPDVTLKGTLKNGTTALAGALVYLQSTPDGTTFTDVTSVTTTATGAFTHTVVAATAGLQYRAVAQGVAGPPVVLPVKKLMPVTIPVVKETITLKLNGRTTIFTILLGRSVTAKGVIAPKLTLSQVVKLTVQKRRANGTWAPVKTLSTVKVTSAYSKIYKPGSRGTFRMRAVLAKTATHTAATSVWRTFKVK